MKTLQAFTALSPEEQFEYVWNHCRHLASREEDQLVISLYYGNDLFVEVWFNNYREVVRVRPFTRYPRDRYAVESFALPHA